MSFWSCALYLHIGQENDFWDGTASAWSWLTIWTQSSSSESARSMISAIFPLGDVSITISSLWNQKSAFRFTFKIIFAILRCILLCISFPWVTLFHFTRPSKNVCQNIHLKRRQHPFQFVFHLNVPPPLTWYLQYQKSSTHPPPLSFGRWRGCFKEGRLLAGPLKGDRK